jgi:3(or 17)beta-hydroxysteroid dehydrogenase
MPESLHSLIDSVWHQPEHLAWRHQRAGFRQGCGGMLEFEGRSVLVTGADGGIGSAIAAHFVAAGARVFLTGVRGDEGRDVAARLGSQASYLELDVTDESQWADAIAQVLALHGRLDVLVNNAGYLQAGLTIENTSLAEWRQHYAVNADGCFLGCKHAILAMKSSGGGAIVNVASAVAVRLHAESPAYGASKAAALALTKIAAMHCGHRKYRIRVNAVLPGPVDTAMMRKNVSSQTEFERLEAMLIQKYPMDRIGTPTDIANVVLFLASDKADYVNGAAFAADGGQSA